MNSSKSKELVLVGPDSSPRGTGLVLVHRGMQKAAPALSCPPCTLSTAGVRWLPQRQAQPAFMGQEPLVLALSARLTVGCPMLRREGMKEAQPALVGPWETVPEPSVLCLGTD